MTPWRFAFASVIGVSHKRSQTLCQDTSDCRALRTAGGESALLAVASDGAGSARYSRRGSQLACEFFIGEVEGVLRRSVGVSGLTAQWFGDWITRFQQCVECNARNLGVTPRELACTLSAAALGESSSAFLQVGDGAIITRSCDAPDSFECVMWPMKGEYANTTMFLTDPGAKATFQHEIRHGSIDDVAVITDGLERVALDLQAQRAFNPFFLPFFRALHDRRDGYQRGLSMDIAAFLNSGRLNERVDDDKTLIVASRESNSSSKDSDVQQHGSTHHLR